tara:strand:- start:1112 stop:1279 length:168 start_codon:yes stop_codon:yes gene_type:complete
MLTQEQLLNLKYYAGELADAASLSYWATDESDKDFHVKNIISHLEKLVYFYKESE